MARVSREARLVMPFGLKLFDRFCAAMKLPPFEVHLNSGSLCRGNVYEGWDARHQISLYRLNSKHDFQNRDLHVSERFTQGM